MAAGTGPGYRKAMGELRLHAISVYDIRDMFGALPDLAAELRVIAGNAFAAPAAEQPRPTLIQRLAPLSRRDPWANRVPEEQPTPRDWEALIEGRHVEGHRLVASWRVVDAWVDARDWGTMTFTMSRQDVEAFDFSLTRAGVPAQYGLGNLTANDAALPLRPAHGMRVGYAKNAHVLATRDCLHEVLGRVEEPGDGPAHQLTAFLDAFAQWTQQARQNDRALPDLFVVWWESSRDEAVAAPAPTGPQPRQAYGQHAQVDPSQPIVTGRQARRDQTREPYDPTQPILTGRQARQDPPRR